MKIIRGTQDSRGVVFQKQPDGGTGRMRCMKCGQLCVATILADGTRVLQCGGCGAAHTTVTLNSKPYVPPFGSVPKRPPSAGGQ